MDPASSGLSGLSSPSYSADWYPDPTGRFEYRYHNGRVWTGDVSADGHRFVDSLPLPSAPLQHPSKPRGSGKATAALVLGMSSVLLGWLPFICIAAIAAAVLAVVFGVGVLRRDRALGAAGVTAPRRGHGMALAGVILAPFGLAASAVGIWLTVVSIREVNEFTNVGAHTVEITSCEVSDGVASAGGSISNRSSSKRSYHVTVEFVRPGTDNRLYLDSTDIDDVPAGESREWSVLRVVDEEELECRVEDVTGPLPFGQS